MLTTLLMLALIGFVAYLIITYIPMPDIIRKVIVVIIAIWIILYFIQLIGIKDMGIPKL